MDRLTARFWSVLSVLAKSSPFPSPVFGFAVLEDVGLEGAGLGDAGLGDASLGDAGLGDAR